MNVSIQFFDWFENGSANRPLPSDGGAEELCRDPTDDPNPIGLDQRSKADVEQKMGCEGIRMRDTRTVRQMLLDFINVPSPHRGDAVPGPLPCGSKFDRTCSHRDRPSGLP